MLVVISCRRSRIQVPGQHVVVVGCSGARAESGVSAESLLTSGRLSPGNRRSRRVQPATRGTRAARRRKVHDSGAGAGAGAGVTMTDAARGSRGCSRRLVSLRRPVSRSAASLMNIFCLCVLIFIRPLARHLAVDPALWRLLCDVVHRFTGENLAEGLDHAFVHCMCQFVGKCSPGNEEGPFFRCGGTGVIIIHACIQGGSFRIN
jgi:hypothetical protein